ncbi:MAG: RraA family protein [Gemmatimonadota bacterium]
MVQPAPQVHNALAQFSAATLHEAAGRSWVLPYELRPVWPGARVFGPAYTVSQEAGSNGWLHRAIYGAPTGAVLVVVTGDRAFGYWGELMASAALERGLAGLVIEGGVRDVEELERLGFPVFASAVCMRGTQKLPLGEGGLGEPLALGRARVRSGDLVVGDRDGVVVLPAEGLDGVMERAERREAKEKRMLQRLHDGERLLDLVLP